MDQGGFNCLNWPRREEGKVEGRPGAARIAVAPGRLSGGVRKKKGKGRGEADRQGPDVSVRGEKEKKEEEGRAAAGGYWWTGRPAGPKGREVSFLFFLFFFKLFLNQTFLFKFKPKSFKLFHKIL
jgi:hypothetical protein